jgi:NADPH-dependent curcumin reductase CurA
MSNKMVTVTRIKMARKPGPTLVADDFEQVQVTLPEPGPGEVLSQTHFISLDPYLTGMMRT